MTWLLSIPILAAWAAFEATRTGHRSVLTVKARRDADRWDDRRSMRRWRAFNAHAGARR